MQLSIREASRFVIGAGMMQQRAIQASGNHDISIESVAVAALREGEVGAKIRQTIETLADQESSWLRNTPPHTLSTERVIQSREAEAKAFADIHSSVVKAIAYDLSGPDSKPRAEMELKSTLVTALGSIDSAPGSKADRELLLSNFTEQLCLASEDPASMKKTIFESEQAYLAADLEKTFSRYSTPAIQRSSDYDDYSI